MTLQEKPIGQVIREEFARIKERYQGVHDAIVPMRASHIAKMESHIETLEASSRTQCECCGFVSNFQIPTARTDARPYEAMSNARLDRLHVERERFTELQGA